MAIGIAWGTLRTSVKHIGDAIKEVKKELHENIKPDLKDVRERFATWEGKQSGLVQSQSPVGLTPKGKEALNKSGLKQYIDSNKDVLIKDCSKSFNMETAYDVQGSAMQFFSNYKFPKAIETKLKNYAFKDGTSLDGMRTVAGIYFRDILLSERGFDPKDLDKPLSPPK